MDSKKMNMEEIHIDEIDNFPIEQWRLSKDDTVEAPINEIPYCSAKNHCQRKANNECLISNSIDIVKNSNTCDQREDSKKQPPANFYPKCHSGIFYKCETKKITDHWNTLPKLHSLVIKIEKRKGKSFYEQFGNLIKKDNTESNKKNTQKEPHFIQIGD